MRNIIIHNDFGREIMELTENELIIARFLHKKGVNYMKKTKVLFCILIYTMLVGGIMGIIKGLVPHMGWFNFRYLLGMGSVFEDRVVPIYTLVYGIFMAILEIISAILLIAKKRIGIKFAIITLSINALGCIIAIILGDIVAMLDLLIRFFAIFVLVKFEDFYFGLDKNVN